MKYGFECRNVDCHLTTVIKPDKLDHKEIVEWKGDYCYTVLFWKRPRNRIILVGNRWKTRKIMSLIFITIKNWLKS